MFMATNKTASETSSLCPEKPRGIASRIGQKDIYPFERWWHPPSPMRIGAD